MKKRTRKPVLPHDLRLAKIDGFGRAGKYYTAESNSSDSLMLLALLGLFLKQ